MSLYDINDKKFEFKGGFWVLEKLKDFFYDCSDALLSLFIILVMVLVITWKLSGAMSIPLFNNTNDDVHIINTENQQANDNKNAIPDNTDKSNPSHEEINQQAQAEEPVTPSDDIEVIQVEAEDIEVEIPKGSTGSGIAKILQSEGLIESTSDFINRVEELGLGPKLRFGTFTIKSNSSLDEIISIITGTSRNS